MMLYYNIIHDDEDIDKSEGKNDKLPSMRCFQCSYFFYISKNFSKRNSDVENLCDECYRWRFIIPFQIQTDKENVYSRIVKVKNGTYRTISKYSLTELKEILEDFVPTNKQGWINKVERIFETDKPIGRFEWINKT